MPPKLVIANKNYSSWSMRPWLLMRAFEIPFDEIVVPLDDKDTPSAILRYNPAGKVPVMIDGPLTIWDSLAIIEHLAERHPDLPFWPSDPSARALARSIVAEMHSGFTPLRRHLPMNMRREPKAPDLSEENAAAVARDVTRIEAIWADARARFCDGGPFLFGSFGIADAMFAPVVNRFHVYAVSVGAETLAYMATMMAHPAWRDWQAAANAEGWRLARIDDA